MQNLNFNWSLGLSGYALCLGRIPKNLHVGSYDITRLALDSGHGDKHNLPSYQPDFVRAFELLAPPLVLKKNIELVVVSIPCGLKSLDFAASL